MAGRSANDRVRLVKEIGDGLLIEALTPFDGLRCVAELIELVHEVGLESRAGTDRGSS